ncbi:MAG: hypothetical protein QOF48_3181 [Verrucomicrobiota bacterium]
MIAASAVCPQCKCPIPAEFCNLSEPAPCPSCRTSVLVQVFPAAFHETAAGQTAEPIVEAGTASCFYHQQKKAVTHCDVCGRFLCALCEVDIGGQHICPICLRPGKKKGKLASLDSSRTLWDSAALVLCLVPIIVWPVVIVTAPAAMTVAILSFYKPGSLVPRRRWRSILVLALSPLEILFWVWYSFFRPG